MQRACAYQPVVCVVIHDLRAHGGEESVKALRGRAFKEAVGLAVISYTVDDIAAVKIGTNHIVHRVYVVLPVAIDGYAYIAVVLCLHNSGKHGVLMAAVAALAYAYVVLVARSKGADNIPRSVAAAVVYKQYAAVFGNELFFGKLMQLI